MKLRTGTLLIVATAVTALSLIAVSTGESSTTELEPPNATGAAIVPPDEPLGHRMSDYRGPTPVSLEGATVVSNEEAMVLWTSGRAVFIDVMPRPPRPAGLPADVLWRPKKRLNIPGSVWLANVGFGILRPEVETYFRANLERIAERRRDKAMLFYCLAECWMSWNAAKRAIEFSYENVYWYPQGSNGWLEIGGKLEDASPVPMVEGSG